MEKVEISVEIEREALMLFSEAIDSNGLYETCKAVGINTLEELAEISRDTQIRILKTLGD